MMNLAARNFELLTHHLGWGDPAGGLWFIGIEEAAIWHCQKELDDLRDRAVPVRLGASTVTYEHVRVGCQVQKNDNGKQQTTIPNFQSYIACALSVSGPRTKEAYRRQKLWVEGSKVFQSNLFPLGKPSVAQPFPEVYKGLFGFGPTDRRSYGEAVKSDRFPLVRTFREKYRPRAVVCFGKTYWNSFRELFELEDFGRDETGLSVYDDECVILAPFFGRGHMSYDLASAIADRLRQWGVELP